MGDLGMDALGYRHLINVIGVSQCNQFVPHVDQLRAREVFLFGLVVVFQFIKGVEFRQII